MVPLTEFKPVEFMFLRVIWDAHHIRFPLRIVGANIKELHVVPETAHPFGRKGLALAGAWKQLADPAMEGVLLLDGDVVIDPHDYMMMLIAIHTDPDAVHIAPTKLWPSSKNDLDGWAWGHCRDGKFSQELELHPDFFAFNFTYIPRKVMDLAVAKGLKTWQFPEVDRSVSRVAREAKVRMTVVEGASPKHMHY
jgi:hypothetical protein